MNVLERRIKVTELTDFEQLLKKLHEIDLSLLGVVKKLEKQSEIVTHKYVFFKVLIKFNFKKINSNTLKGLLDILAFLKTYKQPLLSKLYTFEIKNRDDKEEEQFEHFKDQDFKLLGLVKEKLQLLFQSIDLAEKHLRDLIDLPLVYGKKSFEDLTLKEIEEFKNEIDQFISSLTKIKDFCVELEHYSTFLDARIVPQRYISPREVIKSKQYLDFYDANPNFREQIIATENKIESFPYTPKIHGPLLHVTLHGYPDKKIKISHAYLHERKTI